MDNHPDDVRHVAACPDCQARAALSGLDVDLDRVWSGVAATLWGPRHGRIEHLAAALLGSPGLARALVTTPALVLSWILASAVVLAAGVAATELTGTPWVALLAPALAGIGIAYAYGPGIDPAFELGQTMAISDRQIMLVRCLAVFGLNALLGLVASLVSAQAAGLTLGWLLPMTAISALALAGSTLARSAPVGVGAGLAVWGLIVLGARVEAGDYAAAVERAGLAPLYALVAACGIGLALYATSGRRHEGLRWQ